MENSYFLDSLKLSLSDKYIISDEEIKSLSDIILANGLEDIAEAGHLFTLVYLLDKWGVDLPVSYKMMKFGWESESFILSFNVILSNLIKAGVVSLKRLTDNVFFSSNNINKSSDDVKGEDYHIVIYGTKSYRTFRDELKKNNLMVNVKREDALNESVNISILDSKFKTFVDRFKAESVYGGKYKVDLESCSVDEVKFEGELNFNIDFKRPFPKKLGNIAPVVKKGIKNKYLMDFDAYQDDEDTVFVTMKFDTRIPLADLLKVYPQLLLAFDEIDRM
jgi:hypothetical protein